MSSNTKYIDSPLGAIKIVEDGDVIVEIAFTDEDLSKQDLQHNPKNIILENCAAEMHAYFEGSPAPFTFPIKHSGTPFQEAVWQELLSVKAGQTISYMQLAKKLGNPKSIRAVGTANGKNKIAIAVPCHRIIGTNGAMVGYAGEIWRKQWLLEHEQKIVNGLQLLF